MSIEITNEIVRVYEAAAWKTPDEVGGLELANIHEGLAAVLDMPEVRDAIYAEGVHAERERVRRLLSPPLLAGLRSIPDGTIQNGCVIHDGEAVREKLRAAYRAVVDGEDGLR